MVWATSPRPNEEGLPRVPKEPECAKSGRGMARDGNGKLEGSSLVPLTETLGPKTLGESFRKRPLPEHSLGSMGPRVLPVSLTDPVLLSR